MATYPERRAGRQLTGDLMLVYLDRGELPETVTLVLRPKGERQDTTVQCPLQFFNLRMIRMVENAGFHT